MSVPVLHGQARSGFARIACSTDAPATARAAELAGPGRVLDLWGFTSSADHDLLVP